MFTNLDPYTLQARVSPVLIVCFPVLLLIAGLFPSESATLGLFTGLLSFSGIGPLIGQLGRDRGLEGEKYLIKLWGGLPSTQLFRYRDSLLGNTMVDALHHNMATLLPNTPPVTAADEHQDPVAADAIYGRWASYLREVTRDSPLILQENINYGFRRNLYGLRWIGVFTAFLPLLFGAYEMVSPVGSGWTQLPAMVKANMIISAFAICFHIGVVSPKWVRIAADAYARRLVLASDKLVGPAK